MSTVSPAAELGRIIRKLRKGAGVTGEQLGAKVGMSQSKISKLEHGVPPLPDPQVITNILDILRVPKQVRREVKQLLLELGAPAAIQSVYQVAFLHGRYLEQEQKSTLIQVVTLNVIPALLQTAAYRESLLREFGLEDDEFRAAMRETNLRQDNLWNKAINFEFLIVEAALYTQPAGRQVQLAQLDKLERFIGLPNVEIGIIPTVAGSFIIEQCNFIMYDKHTIFRSVGTQEIENTDRETLMQYVQMFEELSLKARFGPDAARLIATASDQIAQI